MSKVLKLAEATATAEGLRAWCQNTPSMNMYQPLVTSAVESCLASTPNTRKKTLSLAVHAVKRTATLKKHGADALRSPEFLLGLERFESALDMIRRHVESIPEQGTKPRKLSFSALAFLRESACLQAELDRNYRSLLELSKNPTTLSSASRNECILEIATFGVRAAGAICDIPGINFLKPVFGMTVHGNRKAALALADHAKTVTHSIVDRTVVLYGEAEPENVHSLAPLCRALEQVQAFLETLQNRRWRGKSWVLAMKDQDRFTELNSALDKALAVFTSSEIIDTKAEVLCHNTETFTTVVATAHRVNDVERSMTLVRRDLGALTVAVQAEHSAKPYSFRFQFYPIKHRTLPHSTPAWRLALTIAPTQQRVAVPVACQRPEAPDMQPPCALPHSGANSYPPDPIVRRTAARTVLPIAGSKPLRSPWCTEAPTPVSLHPRIYLRRMNLTSLKPDEAIQSPKSTRAHVSVGNERSLPALLSFSVNLKLREAAPAAHHLAPSISSSRAEHTEVHARAERSLAPLPLFVLDWRTVSIARREQLNLAEWGHHAAWGLYESLPLLTNDHLQPSPSSMGVPPIFRSFLQTSKLSHDAVTQIHETLELP
ncbi:hypothetical protein B0H13DRAFT_2658448 [Mycena leptocephala]|nr:hypothetical protein B0H13DRAFT_2658448 [Mycena leptocephala]